MYVLEHMKQHMKCTSCRGCLQSPLTPMLKQWNEQCLWQRMKMVLVSVANPPPSLYCSNCTEVTLIAHLFDFIKTWLHVSCHTDCQVPAQAAVAGSYYYC